MSRDSFSLLSLSIEVRRICLSQQCLIRVYTGSALCACIRMHLKNMVINAYGEHQLSTGSWWKGFDSLINAVRHCECMNGCFP